MNELNLTDVELIATFFVSVNNIKNELHDCIYIRYEYYSSSCKLCSCVCYVPARSTTFTPDAIILAGFYSQQITHYGYGSFNAQILNTFHKCSVRPGQMLIRAKVWVMYPAWWFTLYYMFVLRLTLCDWAPPLLSVSPTYIWCAVLINSSISSGTPTSPTSLPRSPLSFPTQVSPASPPPLPDRSSGSGQPTMMQKLMKEKRQMQQEHARRQARSGAEGES